MQFRRFLGVTALGLISSTGCISQEKYNAQRLRADGLQSQLDSSAEASRVAEAKAASYKVQLDQVMGSNGGATSLIANQGSQIANLQSQLSDITAKYNEAIGKIGQNQPLPAQLTSELTTFADQNPELVEFDPKTGVVKFKSDLTFASGDATLQPAATAAIAKFATILNSPAANGYELMVCGHADNQKVSAGTMSKGHKDNWYLSAHRALSVSEALQKQNVNPKRIGAVGYGEYRPVASNDTKPGMAMNRRVEVLILPTTVSNTEPMMAPTTKPTAMAPAVDMNKKSDDAMNK